MHPTHAKEHTWIKNWINKVIWLETKENMKGCWALVGIFSLLSCALPSSRFYECEHCIILRTEALQMGELDVSVSLEWRSVSVNITQAGNKSLWSDCGCKWRDSYRPPKTVAVQHGLSHICEAALHSTLVSVESYSLKLLSQVWIFNCPTKPEYTVIFTEQSFSVCVFYF